MPVLANFDPRPATLYWLNKKQCRLNNPEKGYKQKWFSNTFELEQNDLTEKAEKRYKKTF